MEDEPANQAADPGLLLRLEGVSKSFGGVRALRGVDFDLQAGEIHALVGENGAGKSTLIKVLGGIHRPEAGRIWLAGRRVQMHGVAEADRHGVRIIHQELSLAPNLSVAENIFLGRESVRFGLLNRRRMVARAERLVGELGMTEIGDVRAGVGELSMAQRQLVEIARALCGQARILVLDEPTSSLSEAETEGLFATLARLRGQGVGIIYISHRLEEIIRLADRVTVLRDGQCVGTQARDRLNQQELVRWMVGREISDHFHRPNSTPGRVVLAVDNLRNPWIHGVSFEVRAGEVLGIAGLVGSGRSELVRAIFAIDRWAGGQICLENRPVRFLAPSDALAAGVVLVPEDRQCQGLVMTQSVGFNIALPWVRDWITGCLPSWRRRGAIVRRTLSRFTIKAADPECPMPSLSGGNQQKVLLGRWMEHPPRLLILDEPTRGVDVGAREEIFSLIASLVESGMAVVLISSDLAEVLNLSHRVAVYRDGRILSLENARTLTPERLMAQLTGIVSHEKF